MKAFLVDLFFGAGLLAVVIIAINLLAHQRTVLGVSTDGITTDLKVVALTFDDGPSPHTRQIMEVLRQKHVQATFFVVGKNIEQYPELIQDAYYQGHQIGNHSQTHPMMYLMNQSDVVREFATTEDQIYQLINIRPNIIRVPYGWYHQFNMWQLLETNYYQVIGWNVDPEDWRKSTTSQEIIGHVVANVQPGSIVLLHDGPPENDRTNTITALPDMIDALHQAGYQFVTVDRLLDLNQADVMKKGRP
jgi:peptidoglycan/xylan/chitin deacetylase (PgdA/CDA1 family)